MTPEMSALFERAEREKLWFHCSYQDLWFSPAALRSAQADGRFRWGAVNWTLRDPQERIQEAEQRAVAERLNADRVRAEVEVGP